MDLSSPTTPQDGMDDGVIDGMDRLPPEIVAKIATYLPDRKDGSKRILPGLATLSRSWQFAIESITFKSLSISTSHEQKAFCRIFANHTPRRSFLRCLVLDIILPAYSDDDGALYETAENRAANNQVFTDKLSAILRELSEWPAEGKLEFKVGAFSLTDFDLLDVRKKLNGSIGVDIGLRKDIFKERYEDSYIRLTGPLTIVVPRVTGFSPRLGPRYLDPGSVVALTAAFPNLESNIWAFRDPVRFLPLRRQQIKELTSAVASFRPPSPLKSLEIDVQSESYPHEERLPNFNSSNNSFCGSLCTLLEKSNIQRFRYTGLIDPTLFWPQETPETDKDPPPWSSLQAMTVNFELGSLAGQWFFKGRPDDPSYDDVPLSQDTTGFLPPGYYDSSEQNDAAIAHKNSWYNTSHSIRCIPRDEAILPLLTAVARRLAHTPSLQYLCLYAKPRSHSRKLWCLWYHAPGQISKRDDRVDCEELGCGDPVSRARVFLYADEWRPSDEVVALLRNIGRVCHGKDAIVTFL